MLVRKICAQITIIFCSIILCSCATQSRNPVPEKDVEDAQVVGFPNIRAYGHKYSPLFQADLVKSLKKQLNISGNAARTSDKTLNILSISGGGSDGAFGAGILSGWTKSGKRPKFQLVTGISTGSLIAPFAFLGPSYDHKISKLYTNISSKDIYTKRSIVSILIGANSVADTKPLAKLIEQNITQEMFQQIAKEHRKGRRLYIGTTNIDHHKLIVWNMGAIASSGKKGSLELFRKILLASASIPVAFPPVKIPVTASNRIYDELHVDGGVTTEVFFYGFMLDINNALHSLGVTKKPTSAVYIIRNSQILTPYKPVKQSLFSIGEKSVLGLTGAQGVGDLYRIYVIAKRDGADYNLIYIPSSFGPRSSEPFDVNEMRNLYKLGYSMARNGKFWQKYPPFLYQETL